MGDDARVAGGGVLPCQDSNNCTESLRRLTGNHRKTAALLARSVAYMVNKFGVEKIGFLTLTFAEHITDARIAQRRFHSLKTHVLNSRYGFGRWIRVLERQKSGRIHYHLIVALDQDIRTGAKFTEFEQGRYDSANAALRQEWAFWRRTAPRYKFGRTELLPIKSGMEALAKYVGKYIAKHIDKRIVEDKGVRLVSAAQGALVGSTRFSWTSPRSKLWRLKLAFLAQQCGFKDLSDFTNAFGSSWAYSLGGAIMSLNLAGESGGSFTYPDADMARADGCDIPESAIGPVTRSTTARPRVAYRADARPVRVVALEVPGVIVQVVNSSPDGIEPPCCGLPSLAQQGVRQGSRPAGGRALSAVEHAYAGATGLRYWTPTYKRGGSRVAIWGDRTHDE